MWSKLEGGGRDVVPFSKSFELLLLHDVYNRRDGISTVSSNEFYVVRAVDFSFYFLTFSTRKYINILSDE